MQDSTLKEGKILIIDDERANVRFLEIVLQQAGYQNVFSTMDPRQALFLCSELKPDLLLLDLHMPHLDGFTLMQILQIQPDFRSVPILVLTADGAVSARHRALAEGAKDFLIKPLDELEVLLRIHNLLETSFRNELLESKVKEAQRFMLSTLDALSSHVAVLDNDGNILTANRAWQQFSAANGGDAFSCGVGANFLTTCVRASGGEADKAWAIARGIRQVMAGEIREFQLEYSCHSPVERRWFTVRVTPFLSEGPVRVVVAHEDITERKRIEDELEQVRWETVQRLARAAEYRDETTGQHIHRVGHTAGRIAQAMGLPVRQVMLLEHAAPLHDVGKIGIPDTILFKPERLTEEEFALMKQHTCMGAQILSGSSSSLLQRAEEIALYHHEHWDGTGYIGLKGENIPLSGRIVSVADAFDVLTHDRPFQKAWTVAAAVAEVENQSGRQFDPQVVAAFLTLPHAELV
jgi:response regulator RpfG family c-di-GMP phosphodiesterase